MSVTVTRMDDGDFGSERRVVVELNGRKFELMVATDGHTFNVDLFDGEVGVTDFTILYDGTLDA